MTECTGMHLLVAEPTQTCILPVHKLLHKFFGQQTLLEANGERAIMAFELQDLALRTHLMEPGKPT